MKRVIVLDTGPLSLVINPKSNKPEAVACYQWFTNLLAGGVVVAIPEIADYEVRRELVRASKTPSITRLDSLKALGHYIPITTTTMLKAADFWAAARNAHMQTADDKDLDGDMILVAQATLLTHIGDTRIDETIIATTNIRHISRFADARLWQQISPL